MAPASGLEGDTMKKYVAAVILVLSTTPAFAQLMTVTTCHGVINPDVTQATINKTICVHGWTATIRPPVSYTSALKRKLLGPRYSLETVKKYELDHCLPLEEGGAPRDPRNLWLQPWNGRCGAHAKDEVENGLKQQVCSGKMTLARARAYVQNWCRPEIKSRYSVKYVPPQPLHKLKRRGEHAGRS